VNSRFSSSGLSLALHTEWSNSSDVSCAFDSILLLRTAHLRDSRALAPPISWEGMLANCVAWTPLLYVQSHSPATLTIAHAMM
jgi:hypothetical protein